MKRKKRKGLPPGSVDTECTHPVGPPLIAAVVAAAVVVIAAAAAAEQLSAPETWESPSADASFAPSTNMST